MAELFKLNLVIKFRNKVQLRWRAVFEQGKVFEEQLIEDNIST